MNRLIAWWYTRKARILRVEADGFRRQGGPTAYADQLRKEAKLYAIRAEARKHGMPTKEEASS